MELEIIRSESANKPEAGAGYTVLFRDERAKPCDPPQLFLCRAHDDEEAESKCISHPGFEIEVLWVVKTLNVESALKDYWG